MFSSPIFLLILSTLALAFFGMYHRLQEVTSTSNASLLPKWAHLVVQELTRENLDFSRKPSKIWRKTLVAIFVSMLLFWLFIDYTITLPMRLEIGLLCAVAFGAWAYYLDKLMIRVPG